MKKRILVLGGGRHQVELIKYINSQGYETVLSDYLPNSPGHKIAHYSSLSSTLDIDANLKLAKNHNVVGIITMGTDQPLNTMATVSNKLGLPSYLTPLTASMCTNKDKMFKALKENGCHLPKYTTINIKEIDKIKFDKYQFPLIIKPIDSQGQRGISVINNFNELENALSSAYQNSNSGICIIQEYIEGPEITISAWLHNGEPKIFLITDRITYNTDQAVGVCLQHIYPTTHDPNIKSKAIIECIKIAQAYEIQNGPLYIQCILNKGRLSIMEATCRIGGGHEDQLIKEITGINIYPLLLELALTGKVNEFPPLPEFPIQDKFALINFILANEGILDSQFFKKSKDDGNRLNEGFYYADGYNQGPIVNSMGRIGFFLCRAQNKTELQKVASNLYSNSCALDKTGENLIFWPSEKIINR